MNRKKIIEKLMKEGLTEKTLVIMNDKQLGMLAARILKEQYVTTSTASTTPSANSPSILNIPRTDQTSINTAKQQKKTFATYEGEMKEDMNKKLGAEKKEYTEKSKAIAAANMKIRAAIKDGKDYGDYTRLIKKLNDGKLPESTQKIIDGKKDINEWVNKVVEKNIHPFTSKGEIMELIDIKLTEQHADPDTTVMPDPPVKKHTGMPDWDKISVPGIPEPMQNMGAGSPQRQKETEVEPDVIPARPETDPGIDPDDPYRDPFPDTDPGPKARDKQHISAKEAQHKIIELIKQMVQ